MHRLQRTAGLGIIAALCFGFCAAAAAWTEPLWVRQLGSDSYDDASGVATDRAGNVYLTGQTLGRLGESSNGLVWLASYSASGQRQWTTQFGSGFSDDATGIATVGDGSIVLVGWTSGQLGGVQHGGYDGWAAKFNASGQRLWARQLGTPEYDEANGVATDAVDNIYVAGRTWGSLAARNQGADDAWVAKISPRGRKIWKRQLGTSDGDSAVGIAVDSEASVYVVGDTLGSIGAANCGIFDAWIGKYSSAGVLLWTRQLGTEMSETAFSVATDAQRNVFLAGTTMGALGGPHHGNDDAWIAKYSAEGDLQWTHQLGTRDWDNAIAVATDAFGNAYLTGYTEGALGGPLKGARDAWVAKFAPSGNVEWIRQLGTEAWDDATGIATDSAGNLYLTGDTDGSLGGRQQGAGDAWVAKFATQR